MKKQGLILGMLSLSLVLAGCTQNGTTNQSPTSTSQTTNIENNSSSKIETLSYSINYEGRNYNKEVKVYVPEAYKQGEKMEIFYLMHGSTGEAGQFASSMKPYLDTWIKNGQMKPMIVVFPTYYPDRSFVRSNYSADYPLNNFFATTEVKDVMRLVEGNFTTYAENTTDEALKNSREYRAFGGYSMGGITTWDTLVNQSEFFYYYMPMAGDSWIGRITGESSSNAVTDTLVSGLKKNNYTADDFKIIAMVGENDGTKSSMIPQINALRNNHKDLINDDNLIYWENARGGHSVESLIAEVEYGSKMLFRK